MVPLTTIRLPEQFYNTEIHQISNQVQPKFYSIASYGITFLPIHLTTNFTHHGLSMRNSVKKHSPNETTSSVRSIIVILAHCHPCLWELTLSFKTVERSINTPGFVQVWSSKHSHTDNTESSQKVPENWHYKIVALSDQPHFVSPTTLPTCALPTPPISPKETVPIVRSPLS